MLGADSCMKKGNSIQCKICFIEDRVTQAFHTLGAFCWPFHKKVVGSFGWAGRLIFCRVCPGECRFTQTLHGGYRELPC